MSGPIRFGILGAAGITPSSLIAPAKTNPDVELTAVSARDRARAEEFAAEHGVLRVVDSYEELMADPEIDAIYNPLPNNYHAPLTIDAIRAGKHVLVEKPFASDTDEARRVAEVAAGSDVVVMEAFHNRYHPLNAQIRNILDQGLLGDLQEVSAQFDIHLPDRSNIRYQYDLAGGALMDLGCYSIHLLRTVLGAEPTVVSATARPADHELVDEAITAELTFPGGIRATVGCSLLEDVECQTALFRGTKGELRVEGFVKPQEGNQLVLTIDGEQTVSELPTSPTTYEHQLAAFVAAVRDGVPVLTDPADSVATMQVIDAVYEAAGLGKRHPLGR